MLDELDTSERSLSCSLAGLPPPASSDLPKECEALLRARGVTPATIAIIGGRIKVGLTSGQLDELAEKGWEAKKHGTGKLWKVGRRELGAALVKVSVAPETSRFWRSHLGATSLSTAERL